MQIFITQVVNINNIIDTVYRLPSSKVNFIGEAKENLHDIDIT